MSRSRIRTATQTAGKRRPRKWTLRALTAVVGTAGALVSLAGPAQAYDERTCERGFGAGNVFDVDKVWVDTEYVDFGDLPHSGVGGGEPQAAGVICWSNDNRVAVVGRLFYDSPKPEWGDASVSARGWSGPAGWWGSEYFLAGSPEAVTNRQVREVWLPQYGQSVDRVHIRLAFRKSPTIEDGTTVVVHESDYFRGD